MKRVLKGVQLLMAVGLIVALAACSGSDGSIKRDRDQAKAAAADAQMALEATAAQAAADKMAADEAAAQAAAAAQMAAEAAAAQAEADKMALEAAAAQAAAAQMAADEAAAQAAAAAQMAADEAAAQAAAAAQMALEAAAAQAAAAQMAADEALAQAAAAAQMAADEAAAQAAAAAQMALEAAAAQAAAAQMAADEALAQAAAAAEMAAAQAAAALEEALAQAAADRMKLADELAGVPKTIEALEAALEVADDALTMAQKAKTAADTALKDATDKRIAAQTAVDEAEADGLTAAIMNLQQKRRDESTADADATTAATDVTNAKLIADAAQEAVDRTDTGPASRERAKQVADDAIEGAQAAFDVLAEVPSPGNSAADPPVPAITRTATSTLKVSHDGMTAKFSANVPTDPEGPVWAKADMDVAPSIEGWFSDTLTSELSSKETGTGIVYSNIEAPEYTLFAVEHNGIETDPLDAAAWKNAVIKPTDKYTGGGDAGSIPGTFQGAEGTFKCSSEATDCADPPTRRGDGKFSDAARMTIAEITGAEWTFEVTDEEATVKTPDTAYLLFGYWLSKTKDGPEQFQVWYGAGGTKSAVGATAATIIGLDETVTYHGVAAGKYVTKDDVANTAQAGYFTATAELEADFTVRAGDHGKLEGTISDFKEGDTAPLGDLKLSLSGDLVYSEDADVDTADQILMVNTLLRDHDNDSDTPESANNPVMAESGGLKHKTVGGWEAQLFGTEKNTNLPTAVSGAFDAEIPEQAVVVGTFGATKVAE